MSKKRTQYSESFKAEAVAKIKENDGNVTQTAQELGIPMNTLKNWQTKANGGTLAGTDTYSPDFQLIAGTNRDLRQEVQAGRFREDLWARLNTWTFFLPHLKDRIEDIAPNIEFELQRFAANHQRQLRFQRDALEVYLKFAKSKDALWQGNFRDLTASVTRLATLSQGELIRIDTVEKEIQRLKQLWSIQRAVNEENQQDILLRYLDQSQIVDIDEFDQIQLRGVLKVCENAKSMADAGRQLFAASRQQRNTTNDSDRVKKYLAKFGLSWSDF